MNNNVVSDQGEVVQQCKLHRIWKIKFIVWIDVKRSHNIQFPNVHDSLGIPLIGEIIHKAIDLDPNGRWWLAEVSSHFLSKLPLGMQGSAGRKISQKTHQGIY